MSVMEVLAWDALHYTVLCCAEVLYASFAGDCRPRFARSKTRWCMQYVPSKEMFPDMMFCV